MKIVFEKEHFYRCNISIFDQFRCQIQHVFERLNQQILTEIVPIDKTLSWISTEFKDTSSFEYRFNDFLLNFVRKKSKLITLNAFRNFRIILSFTAEE